MSQLKGLLKCSYESTVPKKLVSFPNSEFRITGYSHHQNFEYNHIYVTKTAYNINDKPIIYSNSTQEKNQPTYPS